MTIAAHTSTAIAEWREFAAFTAAEQDHIAHALDIGLGRGSARGIDASAVRRRIIAYQRLRVLRGAIPAAHARGGIGEFIGELVALVAFELEGDAIEGFNSLRFLYERLLGAAVRPWLPAAFCAAAALPALRPERRRLLLQTLSETAATAPAWSEAEPQFYPEALADAA